MRALPGARRLLHHLARHNIPVAVATSTPRKSFNLKMAGHADLRGCVGPIVCGDEVARGKPAPDTFLKAAELLEIDPSQCIVFEDAPAGIKVTSYSASSIICCSLPPWLCTLPVWQCIESPSGPPWAYSSPIQCPLLGVLPGRCRAGARPHTHGTMPCPMYLRVPQGSMEHVCRTVDRTGICGGADSC